jgi:hypothetical protein
MGIENGAMENMKLSCLQKILQCCDTNKDEVGLDAFAYIPLTVKETVI